MKTFNLLLFVLLVFALFTYSGCGDGYGTDNIVVDSLRYDGPQDRAPSNGTGFNTFAAYFPPQETQPYVGRRLEKVSFYLQDIPTQTVVIIYAEGTDGRTPGVERYSINLTQRIRNAGFYEHTITDAVIDIRENEGIWIAVETDLPTDGFQAIGCDDGTNYNPNGDRFLPPTGNTWTSFNEINGSETINWNIRGFLAEE
ncbi:MAG: hypothetical protein ACJAWN_001071 [Neolewinella sp.]|jgi:hypothetical protein